MAYRDSQGRVHVGYTDCPTEHAIMVRDYERDEEMAAEAHAEHEAECMGQALHQMSQAHLMKDRQDLDHDAEVRIIQRVLKNFQTEMGRVGQVVMGMGAQTCESAIALTILHPIKLALEEANWLVQAHEAIEANANIEGSPTAGDNDGE